MCLYSRIQTRPKHLHLTSATGATMGSKKGKSLIKLFVSTLLMVQKRRLLWRWELEVRGPGQGVQRPGAERARQRLERLQRLAVRLRADRQRQELLRVRLRGQQGHRASLRGGALSGTAYQYFRKAENYQLFIFMKRTIQRFDTKLNNYLNKKV